MNFFFLSESETWKQQELFSAVVPWTLGRQGSFPAISDHSNSFWWMDEGGRKRGRERRMEGRKGRKGTKEGEEGGVDALDIEWKPWLKWWDVVRKAGEGADPVGRCPVSQRCCSYNLLITDLQLCPSVSQFRAWCVSSPLKRFSSLPRLNGLQLNAQMYSSSLGCWKGNILKNMTAQYHNLEKLEEGRKGYKGGIKQNF